jgi:peptidoglycan/xylan/chitin deacetylase (PgdA/CDA1 family)
MQDLLQNRTPAQGSYVLSFDDGTSDHYDAVFPLLQKHGCQGIFFIPTVKLNKEGYVTNAQIQKLAAAGHMIGFHSHEHRRLDMLSAEEIHRQIVLSQTIITDITGTKPVIFSPPGGFMNESIRKIALEQGVQAIRTMRWGYNRNIDLTALETIPINRYTNEKRFLNILEGHNGQFLYNAKETLKRLVPLRSYERLRSILFKLSKSD